MSIPGAGSPLFLTSAAAAAAGYQINRSLRFNSADSAYLGKTFSSAGSTTTWTLSFWIKRVKGGASKNIFMSYNGSSIAEADYANIEFNSSDQLNVGYAYGAYKKTNRVFRDFSSWYHIVVRLETGNSTASDRVQIYVNGVKETSFAATHDPDSGQSLAWNKAHIHRIGSEYNQFYNDCYFAEIHFVDGTALDADSFGEFDSNNVWQPKDCKDNLTYGTNGFYLKFADNSSNSALGTDSSGNSNTFTVNNLMAAVVPVDVGGDPTVSSSDKPFTTGFSVAFDGNDKMRMEGPGTVSGDFTWECWVKFTGTPDGRFFSAEESVNGTEYSLMRFYNGNLNVYAGDGNGYEANTYTGSVSADTWHHIAMVRSGSTLSHYLDGSRWGTNSFSNSFLITTLVLAHGYGSEYFTGSVSNARFVNGQALYTGASYTVPTATLTTTSQSATATNVTTLVAHKASLTANDGTKIEILNSSSDIDSLIDTPTNYTAGSGNNGGNYPTWNPLSQSSSTFSNGNLQATTSGGSGYPLETVNFYTPPGTGKWYWEFQLSALSGSNYTMVGMLPTDNDYQQGNSNTPKEAGGVQVYVGYDGDVDTATGAATAGTDTATFGVGDILGWAFDAENGTVKCYKNGVAQGTQFTSVRTDVGWAFCVTDYDNSATATYIINFGQRPFAYTPPTGYLSLCTTNLPDPTIADGSTAFDVALWTGNGTSQTISGLNFSPDLVWNKSRSTTRQNHLVDTVRGTGKRLFSDSTEVENSASTNLTAFNSDGFDLGSSADVNQNGTTFVGWTWDAGTSTVSNTDGSITSNVRANPSAGFSIATYTGNGTINSTVGHGLNAAPSLVIIKNRSNSYNWAVLHTSVGTTGTTLDGSAEYYMLQLDGNAARNNFTNDNIWNPTNTTVKVNGEGTANWVNANGDNYVMYSWTPIDQYSSFGSYQGNGSTDGPFVYTGHHSQFLLVKQSSASGEDWWIVDTARETFNAQDQILLPNSSNSEITTSNPIIDILSNGFKLRNTNARFNASGATYVFASFASHPFKTARAR